MVDFYFDDVSFDVTKIIIRHMTIGIMLGMTIMTSMILQSDTQRACLAVTYRARVDCPVDRSKKNMCDIPWTQVVCCRPPGRWSRVNLLSSRYTPPGERMAEPMSASVHEVEITSAQVCEGMWLGICQNASATAWVSEHESMCMRAQDELEHVIQNEFHAPGPQGFWSVILCSTYACKGRTSRPRALICAGTKMGPWFDRSSVWFAMMMRVCVSIE